MDRPLLSELSVSTEAAHAAALSFRTAGWILLLFLLLVVFGAYFIALARRSGKDAPGRDD